MKHKNLDKIIFLLIPFVLIFGQSQGYAQMRSLDVYANGNVRLLIVDPTGKRLGYDPHTNSYYTEIPNADIGAAGIDIVTGDGGEEDSSQANPIEAMIDRPENGEYNIFVLGTETKFFYINVRARHITKPITNTGGGGIIDSASIIAFRLNYDFNDRSKTTLKKEVSPITLRQDIAASYKLNLLGGQKFFKELNKNLDKVEKELSKKDSVEAREKLVEFWKEIEEVRKEMVEEGEKDKDEKKEKFITEDAYKILKEDVTLLLTKLPQRKNHKDDK
ncbi:MAG: hypothetical protein HY088_08460 [Ignavibacteriales bacterium]|nr:hypothetical protein [Ignavibacteriales bacterium]